MVGITGPGAVPTAELGPADSGHVSGPTAEEDPLWVPLTSRVLQEPLDLQSNGSSHIEYAYRDKTSVFLWATGSTNDVPITQLRRIHELQFGDILYHFVIASDGQVFETHRGPKPDEQLVSPQREALHIGLQGDFKQQFPPESLSKGCILLLARLDQSEEQSAAQKEPGARPVRIGTEHWFHKDNWQEEVLEQKSRLVEFLRAGKEGLSEDPDLRSILSTVSSVTEPEFSTAPTSQAPGYAFPETDEVPALRTLLSESVPRLVNKIGTIANPSFDNLSKETAGANQYNLHSPYRCPWNSGARANSSVFALGPKRR